MKLNRKQRLYLESKQYETDIESSVKKILNRVHPSDNEDTIASTIEKEIYLFLESNIGIPDEQKKEFTQKDFGFEFEGRIDMMDGGLLVEYKRPSNLKTEMQQEKAKKQITDYYLQLRDAGMEITLMVVTDGLKIAEVRDTYEGIKSTPFKKLDSVSFNRIITAIISSDSKRLDSNNIIRDFSLKDDGITKKVANKLYAILKSSAVGSKTDLILKEWQELFHLSEADTGKNQDIVKRRNDLSNLFESEIDNAVDEYKGLFALQTTYAIIVKLIACKMLYKVTNDSEIQYFSDLTEVTQESFHKFLEKMEKGFLYAEHGITNLLEGDFFSWYVWDKLFDYELYKLFIELITIIEDYTIFSSENNSKSADVFKDLYIEIMPKAVRHSLGEYFTPAWLADSLISDAIEQIENKKDFVAVDPTCGSGVFLITLIRRIISKYDVSLMSLDQKAKLLKMILSRVKGVDINPLNVLTSRVGYMLAVSPLLSDENAFEIPVYLGDSAVTPEIVSVDGIKCYKYEVSSLQGSISTLFPAEIVDDTHKFSQVINTLSMFTSTVDRDTLVNYITKELSETNNLLIDELYKMIDQLIMLDSQGWNGLWVKIIGNFIKTATIHDVDIVVGNPPWVKWEFLPTKYAERIKAISIGRHLFSGQTYMGAISLNICALIAHVTATTWLKNDGVLAFLMPKTILTQDSYEGFRNFIVNETTDERFYLQKCVDWEKSGHPFVDMKDSFLSYFYKRDYVNYSSGLPLVFVTKKRGNASKNMRIINLKHSFNDVVDNFDFKEGKLVQLDNSRSGFTFLKVEAKVENYQKIIGYCAYKGRSGVEFTPKEVYMLIGKSSIEGTTKQYLFQNEKSKGTTHKVNHIGDLKLETKFVRPLIKGPMITKFNIARENEYCIYPYNHGDTESVQLRDLMTFSPNLAVYLVGQKSVIGGQSERSKAIAKGNDFYSLSKIGPYTYAPFKVIFRDNSKWASAVSKEVESDWGEKILPIPAKHAPYISQKKRTKSNKNLSEDELYISEDEAYYICGVLNSPVVESYMLSTFSHRSISIDLKIKLPLYDEKNKNHKRISDIAKEIEMDLDKAKTGLNEINKLYLEICDE